MRKILTEFVRKSSTFNKSNRIFSGIQPTGQIHLGNYFGALRQWVRFQDNGQYERTIYSIVDLHAITLPKERNELNNSIFEAAATLLATGIDPNKSILFLQSQVSLHAELAWVLGCLISMPRLAQLPQFKEKSKALKEVPLGLFTYPVLQSADMLLYNATHIPVGEDNLQHIHMASHFAKTFNRLYGDTFISPKALIEDGLCGRIRSLRKPEAKMSKSEPDPKSRITFRDSSDSIVEKIKKSVTDFESRVTFDPEKRPGVSNLIMIHSLISGKSPDQIVTEASSIDTGKYKIVVAEELCSYISPIRGKIDVLLNDRNHLTSVLENGADRALELAVPTWTSVANKVGIIPRTFIPKIPILNDEELSINSHY